MKLKLYKIVYVMSVNHAKVRFELHQLMTVYLYHSQQIQSNNNLNSDSLTNLFYITVRFFTVF